MNPNYAQQPPNGVRYPRVGETRQRYFAGTNFKPHNLPENAATPTRRVHAVLGALTKHQTLTLKEQPRLLGKIFTLNSNFDNKHGRRAADKEMLLTDDLVI